MELMIWPREVCLKILPLKIKCIIMICCLFLCFFSVDTAQRYNHLIELIIKDDVFYTLESMPISRFQDQENVYLNIYKSRWSWILGITCLSSRVEENEAGSPESYNWSIDDINRESITVINQGRQVSISLERCD